PIASVPDPSPTRACVEARPSLRDPPIGRSLARAARGPLDRRPRGRAREESERCRGRSSPIERALAPACRAPRRDRPPRREARADPPRFLDAPALARAPPARADLPRSREGPLRGLPFRASRRRQRARARWLDAKRPQAARRAARAGAPIVLLARGAASSNGGGSRARVASRSRAQRDR